MRQFIIVEHAAMSGDFLLDDAPSPASLMDILARCVAGASATCLGKRHNTHVRLLREEDPPRAVRFEGPEMVRIYPDEHNSSVIENRSERYCPARWRAARHTG
jgi:tRNA pseudouridine-54 N-methylase